MRVVVLNTVRHVILPKELAKGEKTTHNVSPFELSSVFTVTPNPNTFCLFLTVGCPCRFRALYTAVMGSGAQGHHRWALCAVSVPMVPLVSAVDAVLAESRALCVLVVATVFLWTLLKAVFLFSALCVFVCNILFRRFTAFTCVIGTVSHSFVLVLCVVCVESGLPKGRTLSEAEWRGIGVQQSRGWVHYAVRLTTVTLVSSPSCACCSLTCCCLCPSVCVCVCVCVCQCHRPEPHILLFRRKLGTDPTTGKVNPVEAAKARRKYLSEYGLADTKK